MRQSGPCASIALLALAGALGACGGSSTGAEASSASHGSATTGSATATGSTGGSSGGASSSASGASSTGTTGVALPTAVTAQTLGLLVNTDDPQSVQVASAYAAARGIPAANVFDLSFKKGNTLDAQTFAQLKADLEADAGANLQAYAISWTFPFAVVDDAGCTMSVTSAFALGFDEKWCVLGGVQCSFTATSPYYGSKSIAPYTDLGIRPTMMLAGIDAGAAEAMIARGAASDGTYPIGDVDLVITTDAVRSVRAPEYRALAMAWDGGDGVDVRVIDNSQSSVDNGALEDAGSVLVYLTGLAQVKGLKTNRYIDGAIGDSLTSYGGLLSGGGQTTALDFLYAGLTGSFGTVREPCNYVQKFTDPTVFVPAYTSGATLVEAYWKSIAWPGEGLFTGDPLARPWGGAKAGP